MDENCYPQTQKNVKQTSFKALILVTLVMVVGAVTTVILCNNITLFHTKSFASKTNPAKSTNWELILVKAFLMIAHLN